MTGKRGPGGYIDPVREAYMLRFGLDYRKPCRDLPESLLEQLSLCRSDEARRILLGVSK
jgi:hypothetical protein